MFRLSNKKALGQSFKCKVQLFVPGDEIEISFTLNSKGQDILNEVVAKLDLLDKDYYGLKFLDQIQWLDLAKAISKQTKGLNNPIFTLKLKYYPAEPALLANESTRYNLYLQLRADLLEGRLKTDSQETQAYLIACIIQSELGDATSIPEANQDDNYISNFKFVPNQSEDLEWAAIRLHQSEDFLGLKPAEAELNFLKKACQLDTYGIDPYPVKDGNSHNHFLIGVNHQGISTFQDSKRTNLFEWEEFERILLDGKLVLIYCRKLERKATNKSSRKSSLFAFRCPSHEYAHNFWKLATEHRYFFTLETTPELPIVTNTGGLFKKNHKLKYISRVEKDLLRDHVDDSRSVGVKRSRSLIAKPSSDGPMWQGFSANANSNKLQTSMGNIYASDSINKTMPSNMNYFREEDEELSGEGGENHGGNMESLMADKKNRPATGLVGAKDSTKGATNRRTVLTSKNDVVSGNAIRRGSQIYMDAEQQSHDFFRASLILFFSLAVVLLIALLISDQDRPNSISLLVKKLNLENVSVAMRNNYYLPLKTALRQAFEQVLSILDSKLI